MRIGILTYFYIANYGANLQALSTYNYLIKKGHDPFFINWIPEVFYETKVKGKIDDSQYRHHFSFVEKYLNITKRCESNDDIASIIHDENIDAIIVGSDAVLQNHPVLERFHFPTRHFFTIEPPIITISYPSPFWGSYFELMSDKKIPSAVMSGSSQDSKFYFIFGKERRSMRESIKHFSYFSVRDTWTQKMISYLTKGDVVPEITPDPVFALKENAKEIIPTKEMVLRKYHLPDKYVLFSFWNNSIVSYEWLKEVGNMFIKDGITPVAFPMPGGVKFYHPFDFVVDTPSPLEWYSIIANASAYIGEKMHPIVTCLANAVPCFNFDHCGLKIFKGLFRYEKSSKIYHIMNEFGVGENRVNGSGPFYKTPKPKYVYDRIIQFDKENCKKKSQEYLEKYNQMMTTILEKFNSKNYD